jgi:hypothetical protein
LAPAASTVETKVTAADSAELNIQVGSEQAQIWIDRELVGRGSSHSVLPAGRHHVRVENAGFDPFDGWVDLEAGQIRGETISLRRSVAVVTPPPVIELHSAEGVYGGVSILGVIQPASAGTPFEDACDTLGATTCDATSPLGAGLSGYVGWFLDPMGLEIALMGTAHVQTAEAQFDGEHGSEINPVVAAPEREEKFTIGRFGGAAALRGRVAYSTRVVRLWLAVGPGIAYRTMAFERKTETTAGDTSRVGQAWVNYWSPLLSLEAGVELRLTRSFGLSLGVTSWLENAGEMARTRARNDVALVDADKNPTALQSTPGYDLARGPQWFIGPLLGFNFGL